MPTARPRTPALLTFAAFTAAFVLAIPRAHAELFVVDSGSPSVKMYDQNTGQFLGNFVDNSGIESARQLMFPWGAAFGTDGSLFVAGFDNFALLRYSIIGGNLGKFADAGNSPSFGQPGGVIYHGGLLYVADTGAGNIKRYDPTKPKASAFKDVFVTGGLSQPEGMAFGPDGNLYVCSRNAGQIVRFNGSTGALIGALINGGSNLSSPEDLAFDSSGRLYVADTGLALMGKVVRFSISSGQFTDVFIDDSGLSTARSLAFGPGGKLFVGDSGNATIRRYTTTGAFDTEFVSAANSGGLSAPFDLIFSAPGGGAKLILTFHWWGLLALTALVGALQLRHRRAIARLQAK
jgi:outer membrane protein assembly factor BamB